MREYLHPFDNDVRYSGMPPVDAGESGVSSVEDMRGMFGGAPPGGAAIYSPRGGGSYRPITMTDAPPSSWQPTPIPENANPFRPGGTSVADIQDPMARRFDALSPADQKLLIRLGNGVKSGELSPVAVVREMQRLMIDENSYGPVGSLPGEAGFFPPNLGQPTPFEAAAGRVGSALAPAVDTWAVLSQINQTNQVIDKAPERWRGGMTLETIGTVGTAASAAGAAATGLPLAGVAGIGIAGASVPMAAATTFGSASGQEGSDPWGGVPHPGIDPRGRKASDPARPGRSDSTAPPKGMSDLSHLLMPDHDAMGYAHGVALGQHIKTQMDQVLKQLPGVPEFKAHFTDHIQNGGVQP
jgi:hypothetical protein